MHLTEPSLDEAGLSHNASASPASCRMALGGSFAGSLVLLSTTALMRSAGLRRGVSFSIETGGAIAAWGVGALALGVIRERRA